VSGARKESKMKVELKGTIGTSKNMIPTCREQTRQRSGKYVNVKFMSFRMWTEDRTRFITDENGIRRRPNKVVQVILPENERGEKIFRHLAGGRRVLVSGRLTHRPNTGKDKDGKTVSYPNPTVYMDEIDFLDEEPRRQPLKFLEKMMEEGLVNDDTRDKMMTAWENHIETLRAVVASSSSPSEDSKISNDPDEMDIG
jgi:hypothetical protein